MSKNSASGQWEKDEVLQLFAESVSDSIQERKKVWKAFPNNTVAEMFKSHVTVSVMYSSVFTLLYFTHEFYDDWLKILVTLHTFYK
jgi:hypothetical protein